MTTKTEPYELLIRFENGKVRGAHYIEKQITMDDSGKLVGGSLLPARPVADAGAQFTSIFGSNADALSQIADLQAQLAAAKKAASASPATSSDALLSKLNLAFDAAIPESVRPQFAPAYAIVRTLVQAGRMDLARAVIEGTAVPQELESAKTQLLALL